MKFTNFQVYYLYSHFPIFVFHSFLRTFFAFLLYGACRIAGRIALLQCQGTGTRIGLGIAFGPRILAIATGETCRQVSKSHYRVVGKSPMPYHRSWCHARCVWAPHDRPPPTPRPVWPLWAASALPRAVPAESPGPLWWHRPWCTSAASTMSIALPAKAPYNYYATCCVSSGKKKNKQKTKQIRKNKIKLTYCCWLFPGNICIIKLIKLLLLLSRTLRAWALRSSR